MSTQSATEVAALKKLVVTLKRAFTAAGPLIGSLSSLGVTVTGIGYGGGRPVLYLDGKPDGVEAAAYRREPVAGGTAHVYAAPYHGAQLEWTEIVPASAEVRRVH